jgi:hypothetical protein
LTGTANASTATEVPVPDLTCMTEETPSLPARSCSNIGWYPASVAGGSGLLRVAFSGVPSSATSAAPYWKAVDFATKRSSFMRSPALPGRSWKEELSARSLSPLADRACICPARVALLTASASESARCTVSAARSAERFTKTPMMPTATSNKTLTTGAIKLRSRI